MSEASVDCRVEHFGSIAILQPLTEAAWEWCADNLGEYIEYGGGIACEPRYAGDIAEGMKEDGLIVH
jgi:hypothetical protein